MRRIVAAVLLAGALVAVPAAAGKTYPLGWHERFFTSGGEIHIAVVVRSLEISSASWQVRLSVTNHSSLSIDVRPRFALIGDRTYRGRLVGANPAPIATGESSRLLVVEGRGRPSGRLRFRLGAFFYPLIPGIPEIAWLSRRSVVVR